MVIGIPPADFTVLYRDLPNSDTDLIRVKPTRIIFTTQCLDVSMRTRHGKMTCATVSVSIDGFEHDLEIF